jgi:hypothetical protein
MFYELWWGECHKSHYSQAILVGIQIGCSRKDKMLAIWMIGNS